MSTSTWADDCEVIRQTLSLYCQLLDDQRYAELGRLFAEDAELPWQDVVLRGRADIVANLSTTQLPKGQSRHLPFSPVIRIDESSASASAWADVIVTVFPPDGPAFIGWTGRYHQRWVRVDGGWRIHRHVAVTNGDPLPDDVEAVDSHCVP